MKVSILAVALVVSLSGCAGFMAYKDGTYISPEVEKTLIVGKTTTEDVKNAFGAPSDMKQVGDLTIYSYNYTEINHIAPNKNEKVVLEFKKDGTLKRITRGKGTATTASNPLLRGFN
ncbi:outer membrane protein assembly factor BamE domain-containing protein [Shewanella septentrionalis]|uniref:Outer membrane protein assembly factor BamE n=1 Tax=Shewanella septentrionalis TaxID=2952223 RepID=A0A9X3AVN1_9GAMM|nr:outer membrane protein assembly factor BamE [Shewanella septentrionalis]MCT7947687.1 outer membrane protein assembly factor BamE [Shewanella septentrionalis]